MRARGFTLIELLVTVVLVTILATAALPLSELTVKRSKEQELRIALRELRTAIDAYKQAGDEGRIEKAITASGYPETLDILVEGAVNIKSPGHERIYFLRRLPRDPFFADADVPAAETWGQRSYASPADDPQEGDDVYDVFSLSEGTGLNGIPYRQW